MPVLRMQTDTVREVGREMTRLGELVSDAVRRLEGSWNSLHGQWQGSSCDQFAELISPNIKTLYELAETCISLGHKLIKEADQWEQIDERGARNFSDVSGLGRYVSGSGWHLVNDPSFTVGELLVQIGGSCTIYGIMNLLIEEGIDISDEDARAMLNEAIRTYGRNGGFPLDAARSILNRYVGEDGYTVGTGRFRSNSHTDVEAAERFLIQNLSQGNPVYVWTEIDDSFGLGSGGHAYTVVGVRTDEKGNMVEVLVSTNWAPPNHVKVISASDFMDDWVNYYDCLYVTIP